MDYFIHNNFLNIYCIRLTMRKYNSESYLRRNIITNPIFHFSVELKFAKHANVRTQSVFLLLFLSGISVCSCVFLSPIGTDLLGGFLSSSMKGSSVTFDGGVVRDVFQALEEGSLSTNGRLLPQSFVGDGVTGNAFELRCLLAMGGDGTLGVLSGSDKLMVVNVVR